MRDLSLFPRLSKLFQTDTIIRSIGGGKIKVMDFENIAAFSELQSNSIIDRFTRMHRAGNNMQYNPSLTYQIMRHQLYADYEAMDTDPILSTVLDIICEESTLKGEKNEVVSIVSTDENIQAELYNLFYNVLNIEQTLPMWIRSLCKYGDLFVSLNLVEKYGIYGATPLSPYDIIREEGQDANNPNYIRFIYDQLAAAGGQVKSGKNKPVFENYEVAHFRLLYDSNYLPYGRCLTANSYVEMKNGVKTIDLIQEGDEVWTYNIDKSEYELSKVLKSVCSGEKEIYKVNTKNFSIEGSENHPILTFKDEKFQYTKISDLKINDKIVLSNFSHLKSTEIKIDKNLDGFNKNGWKNNIDNIPDFVDTEFASLIGFLIGDGWITDNRVSFAQGVYSDLNEKYISLIEKYSGSKRIYDPRMWEKYDINTQVWVSSKMLSKVLKNVGFVGKFDTKRIPEWVFEASEDIQYAFIEGLVESDGSTNIDKWNCVRYNLELSNKKLIEDVKILLTRLKIKSGKISKRDRGNIAIFHGKSFNKKPSYSINFFLKGKKLGDVKKYKVNDNDNFILQPLLSIEKIKNKLTYDIQVESDNSNFIANGVIVHNSFLEPGRKLYKQYILALDAMMLHRIMRSPEKRIFYVNVGNIPPAEINTFMQNHINALKKTPFKDPQTGDYNLKFNVQNMMEDFHIPVRPGDTTTRIDTTKGLDYDGISDVEFLRDLMLTAIKVPKAFLNYSDELNGKSTISALDLRFNKTIERIQRAVISELKKIACIHLYILGYDEDHDMSNFKITMNNSSILYEQEKIALMKEKVDLHKQMKETSDFSSDFIMSKLWEMSEDNMLEERDLVVYDKARAFRLNQIETEGNDPAISGESYGTPHDLAGIYNRNAKGKGSDVPDGYDEKKEVELGRPKEKASIYNTDKSSMGRDPLGKKHGETPKNLQRDTNPRAMALENKKSDLNSIKSGLSNKYNKRMLIFEEKQIKKTFLDENLLFDDI